MFSVLSKSVADDAGQLNDARPRTTSIQRPNYLYPSPTHRTLPPTTQGRPQTPNSTCFSQTVNSGLQSFFYHLLRHPPALAKATQEVDDAVNKGLCATKVVSFADAQQLPYVQACIKEALRIFHPVPMGLPRTVPAEGITIGDRTFKEGTILSVNPWVLHRSREIWGPDAREFVPERWFREGAAELEKRWYMPVSL